jgi:hypothetical protein
MERHFVAALVLAFMVFCAANQYSRMQFNSGFRYFVPLVPFIFLTLCDHLVRWSRTLVIAASAVAVANSWVICMVREPAPESWSRFLHEGFQLPWLTVLRSTTPQSDALLFSPLAPAAAFASVAAVVAGIWILGARAQSRREILEWKRRSDGPGSPTVDVVIPVLNEVKVLEQTVRTLRTFLRERFPYKARIVIAENGSRDGTVELARRLAATYDDVQCVELTQRGRGRALRLAWTQSTADIVAYMDVDLSTELEALKTLCRAIHEEGYGVATGSRLMAESRVRRSLQREVISRLYNVFVRYVLWTKFSDAQCGFKAASRRVVEEVIPLAKDEAWFFDTELLVLCEKMGYRVKDVAVRWDEDSDSRVKIVSTAWEDIKGVLRLRWMFWTRNVTPASPAMRDASAATNQERASDGTLSDRCVVQDSQFS